MFHGFDIEIAKKYGVDIAIIVNHFDFWLTHNKANGKNIFEDKVWTYNSVQAMCEIFPYWTINQIRRALDKMITDEILEKGNHNQVKYDRTTWYTFTESFCKNHKSILQFCQMEVAKTTNGFGENNEPIPVSNHPEKQLNKQKKESLDLSFLDQEPEKYKQAFLEYVEHRKSLKKPMNQQQVETTHKRLLTVSINERIESIEASISAGWQGLFLPKSKKQEQTKTTQPVNPRPTHCDHCGKPMVTNKCSCGRQLFSNNGVYSFEDGPSVDVKKQFNEAMRILL